MLCYSRSEVKYFGLAFSTSVTSCRCMGWIFPPLMMAATYSVSEVEGS